MGYYIRTWGDIVPEPPITYDEIREHREWLDFHDREKLPGTGEPMVKKYVARAVRLETAEAEVDTDEGVLKRITGVRVKVWEGELREFTDDLQALVNTFGNAFRRWTGVINVEGEDNDDMRRVYVRGGRVVTVKPEIVWPSDPPEDPDPRIPA